jgi:hypothetical protein
MDSSVNAPLRVVGLLSLVYMVYGSTEAALIEVMIVSEESSESETSGGVFTSVGAVARAEGDVVHFEMDDLCWGTVTKPPLFPHGWVAVISLFDYDSNNAKRQSEKTKKKRTATEEPGSDSGYKSCSFVGQASRILLWGAAAIVFLSEQEDILTEMDGEQQVHRPVIAIFSTYARRVAQLLRVYDACFLYGII